MGKQIKNPDLIRLRDAYSEILSVVAGPKWNKDKSLVDTPMRAAQAMLELVYSPDINFRTFETSTSDGSGSIVVVQNGIVVHSLCEHHLLPFYGTACVAILPDPTKRRIVGLSKLARIVKHFAAGLNTQERITSKAGEYLMSSVLNPVAVGVSLKCVHMCMCMRGVRDPQASTLTHFLGGNARLDSALRAEILSAMKHPSD